MLHKKGQGLSMKTIVIAALALLVLIVLVISFSYRMGLWSEGMDSMDSCDTYCKSVGYPDYDIQNEADCDSIYSSTSLIKRYKYIGNDCCCYEQT